MPQLIFSHWTDSDINCPYCAQGYVIEWFETPDGEPVDGVRRMTCMACNKEFALITNHLAGWRKIHYSALAD